MSDGEPYGGALGAFPYAVRASDSWALRTYAVVAALAALATVALFVFSLVGIVATTANQTASVTIVRAFVLVLMLGVLAPTVAPVLLVARRHRLGLPAHHRYDAALAASGFAFLASLYVGLVVSTPPAMQQSVSGPLAPVVEGLYALPALAGVIPPLSAAAGIWLAHRTLRSASEA
jgi:hypothetical protein